MRSRQFLQVSPARVLAKDPANRFKVYTERHLDRISALSQLSTEQRFAMRVVAKVLPFRVNQYVIDELIDWDRVPEDPLFQLVFPQPGMLLPADFKRVAAAIRAGQDNRQLQPLVDEIRAGLNPHPAGQQRLNQPVLNGKSLPGMQHKYKETVLFFPAQGQTCHSYCTFCFRWAQFVGDKALRFASSEAGDLHCYLRANTGVTDLLLTGGDPLVMKTSYLQTYLEPLLAPEFEHLQTIRIGSKSLSFWPQRFVSDPDADELLRLLERMVGAGKHVALMAHYNHWRELDTPMAQQAIKRVRATGVIIRTQAPVLKHINDSADVWARMWHAQVRLGMSPYYMFVERNTGAQRYFELPLARAHDIYRNAMQQVSGLARTARGPSMSASPGKVEIQGISDVAGEKVFVLRFIQGRNPDWVQKPFFAKYDEHATWLDQLKPAFGQPRFFFEDEFERLSACR